MAQQREIVLSLRRAQALALSGAARIVVEKVDHERCRVRVRIILADGSEVVHSHSTTGRQQSSDSSG